MLPRDRPLWRLVVIEGLASGEVALYSKIHHALLDGQGGIALAQALLDLQPRIPKAAKEIEVVSAEPLPGARARAGTAARATVSQFARLIRAVPATLKLAGDVGEAGLIGKLREAVLLAPKTPFNVQIGGERAFAVASIDLVRVKRVAKGHGASLNDVVMALVAHALREHLKRRTPCPTSRWWSVCRSPCAARATARPTTRCRWCSARCPPRLPIRSSVCRRFARPPPASRPGSAR